MAKKKNVYGYYWNKPSAKENEEKFQEARKGNYICQIIGCKTKAKYIFVAKDDSDQKMYCSYHVNELMFNPIYGELFCLKGSTPPFDERCVGEYDIKSVYKEENA